MYRLGRGEWGDEGSEIVKGLWQCLDQERVIEILTTAARAETGHRGSQAYAQEALWLYQLGGGQRRKAG